MEGLHLALMGFKLLCSPLNITLCMAGVFIGIIFGVIPGLTGTICLVMLVPLTYAMQPLQALVLLTAVYCGAVFGGSISAITLNIPGTPEAICTTFDGYPMAQKGLAGKAIGIAVVVSAFGGLVSVIMLLLLGPLVANWALAFSSTEYFSLILMGLCCVSGITGASLTKGFLSMFLGVLVSAVGMTPITGDSRFTFGSIYLASGFEFMPIVIGFFAISEFLVRFEEKTKIAGGFEADAAWPSFRELWGLKSTIGISTILGYVCGAIPGLGATLASFLGYGAARSYSKNGSKFGTGVLEGVAAPETANNAATGGAMLPLLTMGIPGGTATAIMLGVLILHGIEPGPNVFRDNPDLIGASCSSMILANVLIMFMGFFLAKPFASLLKLRWGYLVVIILVFCFIGAFSLRSNFMDVYTMLASGILGYAMRKGHYPLAPLILGVILGHMLETQFLRTMLRTGNSLLPFFTRPISLAFLVSSLILLIYPLLTRSELMGSSKGESKTASRAEFLWLCLLIGIAVYVIAASFEFIPPGTSILNSAALWPMISAGAIILLAAIRISGFRDYRSLFSIRSSGRTWTQRPVLIGTGWIALFIFAEMVVGHIFASLAVLPFLLRFSGIQSRKHLFGVPLVLMAFTTVLFTVWFYVALPKGWGIFYDIERTILYSIEKIAR